MQTHHDIRSSRHENSGVHRAIVFVGQPRQIAKLVATTYSLDALTARFLGAAHFPPDDDPFLCVHATTAILADSVIISRHFHPLIHVVFCRGFMLLEIKAKVMHHRWLARENLDGRDPGILLERSRNRQLLPFLDTASRDRIERKINSNIRLDLPTVCGPLNRGRRIFRIAFHGSTISPGRKSFDLGGFQGPVVVKVAVLRVREPGRHLFRKDRRFDRLRPRPGFLMAHQRHRSNLTWPMATLAILLQDRKHVLVESNNPAGLLIDLSRRRPPNSAQQQDNGR